MIQNGVSCCWPWVKSRRTMKEEEGITVLIERGEFKSEIQ
jgi:hypothetical protein